MGILDRLGLGRSRDLMRSAHQLGIVSPYAPAPELPPFVITDLLDEETVDQLPLSRAEAMSIPAVSKARNLLVSAIAPLPLRALAGKTVLPTEQQPTFLYRTNSHVTPYERMAWTVDDLIFHGYSLWLVRRGAEAGGRRPILDAEWCPTNQWTITDGHILVDEQEVDDDDIILFNSPFEGLLNVGARTIKGARDTERAWTGRMRNPIPMVELHMTDDSMAQEEVKPFVESWSKARRSIDGAIGYTPPGLELRVHGALQHELFTEGRNAIRTDIGSFLNVRAAMLDGTTGVDSLTYTTKDGERNLFYELDLPFWTNPVEARLSMDDVVPRGQRIRFDMSTAVHPPTATGPTVED